MIASALGNAFLQQACRILTERERICSLNILAAQADILEFVHIQLREFGHHGTRFHRADGQCHKVDERQCEMANGKADRRRSRAAGR